MKENEQENLVQSLNKLSGEFYKDYYKPIDKEIFIELMRLYYEVLGKEYLPAEFLRLAEKHNFNFASVADYLYKKTAFTDSAKIYKLLDHQITNSDLKKLRNDPVFEITLSFIVFYGENVRQKYMKVEKEINDLYQLYIEGLMEFKGRNNLYPDANFTLRVSYGKINDYYPRDAVHFLYQSTLEGVMEKDDVDVYDYKVPERLKELYRLKDYGQYGKNEKMPVCFISGNHTSGGNSGSPVLNACGELIGLNFDRNWEGTMSDYFYDAEICRNIVVDIRYVLFIIDKFAGAGYLVDEMTLID